MERGQGCHILPAGWATLVHKTLPLTLLSLSRLKVGDELEDAFVATCDLRTSKKILRHQRYSHLTRDTVWTVKFEKKYQPGTGQAWRNLILNLIGFMN